MLKLRLLSSLVGIPVVLVAILSGLLGVASLTLLAGLLSGNELFKMSKTEKSARLLYIAPFLFPILPFIIIAALGISVQGILEAYSLTDTPTEFAFAPLIAFSVISYVYIYPIYTVFEFLNLPNTLALPASVFYATIPLIIVAISLKFTKPKRRTAKVLIPVYTLYLCGLLAFAPALVAQEYTGYDTWVWFKTPLLLAIFATFATDTSAYFVGKIFGRHKIAPKISPAKTWEGFIGGIIGAVTATLIIDYWIITPEMFILIFSACIGIGISLVATIGDLFESYLKRTVSIKGSSSMIPGHGGLLDRTDSLAPNLAFVLFTITFMKWIQT